MGMGIRRVNAVVEFQICESIDIVRVAQQCTSGFPQDIVEVPEFCDKCFPTSEVMERFVVVVVSFVLLEHEVTPHGRDAALQKITPSNIIDSDFEEVSPYGPYLLIAGYTNGCAPVS